MILLFPNWKFRITVGSWICNTLVSLLSLLRTTRREVWCHPGSDLISRFRLRFLGGRRLANGFGFSRGGSCRKCPKFVDISHPSFLNIAIGGGIWDMSRVTIPVGTTTGQIWSWICWSGGIAWTIIFSKLFSVGITPEKSGTIGTCCFRGYAWLGYFLWFWSNLLGTLLVTRFLLGVRQKTFFA